MLFTVLKCGVCCAVVCCGVACFAGDGLYMRVSSRGTRFVLVGWLGGNAA